MMFPLSSPATSCAGRVVGRHRGVARYTIGQRRGLGVAAERPVYVTAIDASTNRIIVGSQEDLLAKHAQLRDGSLAGGDVARFRNRGSRAAALPPCRCARLHLLACPRDALASNSSSRSAPSAARASRQCSIRTTSSWEEEIVAGEIAA